MEITKDYRIRVYIVTKAIFHSVKPTMYLKWILVPSTHWLKYIQHQNMHQKVALADDNQFALPQVR